MNLPHHSNSQKNKDGSPIKISHKEDRVIELLSSHIDSYLQPLPTLQPIVIVCVGTDRSTGDSLGPIIGSKLKNHGIYGVHLFGTLDEPVHAMNLNDVLTALHQNFNNPYVIAVDACLGQLTSVGCVQVGEGPIKPGAGVNKDLPPVGNIHVTGIVNVGGFMEYFVLQNTRLSLVMNMADVIAQAFTLSLSKLRRPAATPLAKID